MLPKPLFRTKAPLESYTGFVMVELVRLVKLTVLFPRIPGVTQLPCRVVAEIGVQN